MESATSFAAVYHLLRYTPGCALTFILCCSREEDILRQRLARFVFTLREM